MRRRGASPRRAAVVPVSGIDARTLPGGAVLISFELAPRVASPCRLRARLTPAQSKVVTAALAGLRDTEIARALGRSRHTVSNLLRQAYRRLGVSGRIELAALFASANVGRSTR